jgi:hypothetical protein
MRCMITANRRASATIAFFIPQRLATCITQASSQDHFFERIMLKTDEQSNNKSRVGTSQPSDNHALDNFVSKSYYRSRLTSHKLR